MDIQNIKDTIQAVIDGLTPLAQKLQIPLERVFGWAIKQNYVYAISELIGFVVLIGAMIGWIKLLKYGLGEEKDNSYSRLYNSEGLLQCITFILGVCLVIGFIGGILLAAIYNWIVVPICGGVKVEFSEHKK
jgi:hypothetical protein